MQRLLNSPWQTLGIPVALRQGWEFGYFENRHGFSMESNLQGISLSLLLWKRNNLSAVIIFMRQTCGQRSSRTAGDKRRALPVNFPIRIWYKFRELKWRGESDLSLFTTSGLAKRIPGPHTMLCCTRHLSAVRAVWSALSTQCTVNLEHSNALSTQCTRSNWHSALSATHLTGTEFSVRASCVVPCAREPRRPPWVSLSLSVSLTLALPRPRFST